MTGVFDEFKETFFRPSVVDFLVALIFGNKLTETIEHILTDILGPLFSILVYNIDNFDMTFQIKGNIIDTGPTITSITSFILSITIVFFFIVKPFKFILNETEQKETKKETEAIDSLKNIEKMLASSSQALRL